MVCVYVCICLFQVLNNTIFCQQRFYADMSTSLAEQLKRLEAPQTSLLVHKTKKASFLFDSRQAAEFDRDTIYELG